MSLVEKIGLAFKRKTETARDAYLKALRGGDPELIAAAAVAAGIEPTQIAADAGILDRAAELIGVATNFPKLQAQSVKAVEAANAAQKKLDDAIAPLMAELDRTTLLALQSQSNERDSRNSVGTLAALCAEYPHLLNLATMPLAVKDFVKSDHAREQAESASRDKIARIERTGQSVQIAHAAWREAQSAASSYVPYNAATRGTTGAAAIARLETTEKALAAAREEYEKAIADGKPRT